MNKTFCTIISANYRSYAETLFDSLVQFDNEAELNVLVVDANIEQTRRGLNFLSAEEIRDQIPIANKIYKKYHNPNNWDTLRWSFKPALMLHLLQAGYDQVIFTDPDTHYYSDYQFLFDELHKKSILLTPNWSGKDPKSDLRRFNYQFTDGIYNAGFIGASRNGKEALHWWAEMCLFECKKIPQLRYFDDQHYLNLMPVYFDDVSILKHRGCNVAGWNLVECPRTSVDSEVVIAGKWPIVFVHFSEITFNAIANNKDDLLKPYSDLYERKLKQYGIDLDTEKYKFPTSSFLSKMKSLLKKSLRGEAFVYWDKKKFRPRFIYRTKR